MTPSMIGRLLTLGFLAVVGALALGSAAQSRELDACGLPDAKPLWIDYGEGSVPKEVRDVLARPGVVLGASGTVLPKTYRENGAKTVFFVLNLPRLVGDPTEPADPASVANAVDQTYDRAVASTECSTPIIGLNELLGPAAPVPWSPPVAQYRANVLALVRGLAAKGARPHLFVHGNPIFTGEAAAWWQGIGAVSDVVYEAYYNAPVITRLGRIVGTRRMRLGMRSVTQRLVAAGIPRERIGYVLGFQVAIGAAGREGLQPSSDWFRYVKWNALAARQVVQDEKTSSVWSWGWGNFGPQSVDPDKPAAACVYLWGRDPALCDGPAAAGTGFKASRVEGTITLRGGETCVSASGRVYETDVQALTPVGGSRAAALSTLFTRVALRPTVPIKAAEILAYEQRVIDRSFGGQRTAYLAALTTRRATLAVARGVIADQLRRQRIATVVASADPTTPGTVLAWTAARTSAEADTATCRRDELPGSGDFPASNSRDVGSAPLLARLRFLGADTIAPGTPTNLRITADTGGITLDWDDGLETDVIGYLVYRKDALDAPFAQVWPMWLPKSSFVDRSIPVEQTPIYVVRAVDASGNLSAPTPEQAPSAAGRTVGR
jgi:hypothetical protein